MSLQVYRHVDPACTLVPLLQSHLPQSGPLLRVIQSFQRLPRSKDACVLATFPPYTEQRSGSSSYGCRPSDPWMVAYVDVFRHPETQMWMYSSLEKRGQAPPANIGSNATLKADEETLELTRAQLRALLAYVRTELISSYISSTVKEDRTRTSRLSVNGVKKIPITPQTGLLMGSINDGLVDLLNGLGPRTHDSPDHLKEFLHINRRYPCLKFLFNQEIYSSRNVPPAGYDFCDRSGQRGIQEHQFELVMSRTPIVRTRVAFPASVALYYHGEGADKTTLAANIGEKEMPIGWAFLTYDGSMIVLHVEPEHRGQGLGPLLSREIMRMGMGPDAIHVLQPETDIEGREKGWVFADVSTDNIASQRVMAKVGGETGWAMSWVAVEVCVDGQCATCSGL